MNIVKKKNNKLNFDIYRYNINSYHSQKFSEEDFVLCNVSTILKNLQCIYNYYIRNYLQTITMTDKLIIFIA